MHEKASDYERIPQIATQYANAEAGSRNQVFKKRLPKPKKHHLTKEAPDYKRSMKLQERAADDNTMRIHRSRLEDQEVSKVIARSKEASYVEDYKRKV